MKRLTRAIVRLYPGAWRQRYETELETLIDETGESWCYRTDLLLEALKMRILAANWRLAAFALAGILIAFAISLYIPNRYQSGAVLQIAAPGAEIEALRDDVAIRVGGLFSRPTLAGIILKPDINLYPDERRTMPLEAVIQRMATEDSRVGVTETPRGIALHISYIGANPAQARRTVQEILNQLVTHRRTRINGVLSFEVLDAPYLPSQPLFPNRRMFAFAGFIAGLLLLLLLGLIRRAPRTFLLTSLATIALSLFASFVPVSYSAQGSVAFESSAARQAALDYLDTNRPIPPPGQVNTPFQIERLGSSHVAITSTARVRPWSSTDTSRPSIAARQVIQVLTSVPSQTGAYVTRWPLAPTPAIPPALFPTMLAISAALALASAAILLRNRRTPSLTAHHA